MSPAVHPQVSSIVQGEDWSAAGDMTVVVESGAATVSQKRRTPKGSDDSINTFCHQHGIFDRSLILDNSLLWHKIRE